MATAQWGSLQAHENGAVIIQGLQDRLFVSAPTLISYSWNSPMNVKHSMGKRHLCAIELMRK